MPVRLKAFDHVEANKRPIYVLEQKNEGIYVRLNENRVRTWLQRNGLPCSDAEGVQPKSGEPTCLSMPILAAFLRVIRREPPDPSHSALFRTIFT